VKPKTLALFLIVSLLFLFLQGCGGSELPMYELSKPNMTYDSYRFDYEQCMMQYRSSPFWQGMVNPNTFCNWCMKEKGYSWQKY
jgi:hypothetical protein